MKQDINRVFISIACLMTQRPMTANERANDGWRLSGVVCRLLSVVCCLSSYVYCLCSAPSSVVCRLLSVVCHLSSVIFVCYRSSVRYLSTIAITVVCYLSPMFCSVVFQLSYRFVAILCLLSVLRCLFKINYFSVLY